MRIIKIESLDNGGHQNRMGDIKHIPEGWAVIPENMETPNYPFGKIEVEEIEGVMTVTKWEAGVLPTPTPTKREPTAEELINIILGVN